MYREFLEMAMGVKLAVFRHDINKRGKMTQSNTISEFFRAAE